MARLFLALAALGLLAAPAPAEERYRSIHAVFPRGEAGGLREAVVLGDREAPREYAVTVIREGAGMALVEHVGGLAFRGRVESSLLGAGRPVTKLLLPAGERVVFVSSPRAGRLELLDARTPQLAALAREYPALVLSFGAEVMDGRRLRAVSGIEVWTKGVRDEDGRLSFPGSGWAVLEREATLQAGGAPLATLPPGGRVWVSDPALVTRGGRARPALDVEVQAPRRSLQGTIPPEGLHFLPGAGQRPDPQEVGRELWADGELVVANPLREHHRLANPAQLLDARGRAWVLLREGVSVTEHGRHRDRPELVLVSVDEQSAFGWLGRSVPAAPGAATAAPGLTGAMPALGQSRE